MSSHYSHHCSLCTPLEIFQSIREKLNHVKKKHLSRLDCDNGVVYQCCYGPNSICQYSGSIEGNPSVTNFFRSLQEFELHFWNLHSSSNENNNRGKWLTEMCIVNLPAALNNPNNRKTWGDQFEKQTIPEQKRQSTILNSEFMEYIKTLKTKRTTKIDLNSKSQKFKYVSEAIQIPTSFFDPSFSLDDEMIFHKIIPLHYRQPKDKKSLLDREISSHAQLTTMQKLTGTELSLKFNGHHENLSHFLDAVELKIVQQVSTKSSSFFDAILCHDVAREKIDTAVDQVRATRKILKQVESKCVYGITKLFSVFRRLKNVTTLLDRLNLLATTCSVQSTLQALLNQRDYFSALEVLHTTMFLLTQDYRKSSLKRLSPSKNSEQLGPFTRGLHCVRHLTAQLKEYPAVISLIAKNDFESSLSCFLIAEDLDSNGPNSEFIITRIVPCFLAFLKLERFDFVQSIREIGKQRVVDSLQHFICDAFKNSIVNNHSGNGLQESNTTSSRYNDTASESSQLSSDNVNMLNIPVAEQLRSLPTTSWIDFMDELCSNLYSQMFRLKLVVQSLELIISHCSDIPVTNNTYEDESLVIHDKLLSYLENIDKFYDSVHLSSEQSSALIYELNRAFWDTCDLGQERLSRLISSRLKSPVTETKENSDVREYRFGKKTNLNYSAVSSVVSDATKLTMKELNRLTTTCTEYQTICLNAWNAIKINQDNDEHVLPGPKVLRLRQILLQNYHLLLDKFHEEKQNKLAMLLQHEKWQIAPVPTHMQRLVDGLFQAAATLVANGQPDVNIPETQVINCLNFVDDFSPSKRKNSTMSDLSNSNERVMHEQSDRKLSETMYFRVPHFVRVESGSSLRLQQQSGESYAVIGTVVLLVPVMIDYLRIFREMQYTLQFHHLGGSPHLFGDQIAFYLADLLNIFNASTYRLILGAEARSSADLSSISARHLALTARSLEFVLRCIEPMDFIFNLPKKSNNSSQKSDSLLHVLTRHSYRFTLPKIEILIKQHIDDISRKLLSLLAARINQKIPTWQPKPPVPSNEIRFICQAMAKLANLVMDLLSSNALKSLLCDAHEEFKEQIRQRLLELNLRPDGSPLHSIVEAEISFYLGQFKNLTPNLSNFSDSMTEIWPSSSLALTEELTTQTQNTATYQSP